MYLAERAEGADAVTWARSRHKRRSGAGRFRRGRNRANKKGERSGGVEKIVSCHAVVRGEEHRAATAATAATMDVLSTITMQGTGQGNMWAR